MSSNNTNKLSPQEHVHIIIRIAAGSNNTNKLSPQELHDFLIFPYFVQIIQINLVLKNIIQLLPPRMAVQIIQINLVLKNLVYEPNHVL